MDSFRTGKRVRVSDPDHRMVGMVGTVHRLRYGDRGAWVHMDADPPEASRAFPVDDPHGRGRLALLFPFECQPDIPTPVPV